MGVKRNLSRLKAEMTEKKKAWKADPENKSLKSAFKKARKTYRENVEESTPENQENGTADQEPKENQKEDDELKTLEKKMKKARKAFKADKGNSALQKAFKKAKKWFLKAQAESRKEAESDLAAEKKEEKIVKATPKDKDEPEAETELSAEVDVGNESHDKTTRVFVANLSYSIDEESLRDVFKTVGGGIVSIKWGEDKLTGEFKGYAHVDFKSLAAAEQAISLSGTEVLGREMRLELSENNGPAASSKTKNGSNLSFASKIPEQPAPNPQEIDRCFVGNLSWKIDKETLIKAFAEIGLTAEHIFWVTDKQSGDFYGTSFVTFKDAHDAAMAVAYSDDGLTILKRPVKIQLSAHKSGIKTIPNRKQPVRETSPRPEGGTTTAFFGNLSYNIDDESLKKFCEPSKVKTIRWLTHKDSGNFKGSGFVDFFDVSAVDEIMKKNGFDLLGRPVRIDYA
mmetsp:Transcript_11382/g.12924  ORF Transcript_11382/g.12924 Transcript_11382/m.12924 type:complete len:454 (-) Transcript_11382:1127-2488(-)|eukprot:CAMPEP_0204825690 /NCGR_PEP_ID=MMETSP1346-20131115/3521_1 /ASSEMBLY_ACC=CAM_ASM_000771 /TAXON_ID=215587 /ORGANISM="Aplanochytrium stocchinoi, Strain GSBS06" /LENGTH=453 /DNA_ID=CAMNT_0051953401 /DNA_START=35 /DNA_END=1396 /DNA_ORIENTATION=+